MTNPKTHFQNLISSYGFQEHEAEAADIFKGASQNIMAKHFMHVQNGGRVSMPLQYFGTGGSTETGAEFPLTVSDTIARAPLEQTFPQSGGALGSVFEDVLKQFRTHSGQKFKLSKEKKHSLKVLFADSVDKLFGKIRKIASKTKVLKASHVSKASKKI
jgi:hypothetical protein